MAENGTKAEASNGSQSTPEEETNYKAPAPKALNEILSTDVEDESLQRYKKALLDPSAAPIEPDNPKNVLVRSLTLLVDGRPDETVTLEGGDLKSMEKKTFTIKEGCQYKLRINFHIQREIVAGLKYIQKVHKHGIPVDKDEFMVGSYGPKAELQSYTTPIEEAPSGMMMRGTYKVKSQFTDDDKHDWLSWEWNLEIKKDWQ